MVHRIISLSLCESNLLEQIRNTGTRSGHLNCLEHAPDMILLAMDGTISPEPAFGLLEATKEYKI
jgi:hypothetical protein